MKLYVALSIALMCLTGGVNAQQQKETLLIGVFHFNNPGADLAKSEDFDVMSKKSQQELAQITDHIRKFRPDKIFVEWDYNDQMALDTLYDLYQKDAYFDYVQTKFPKSKFYLQNEIFQLAFRAGKKAGLQKIHAIDYQMDWPYDSLQSAIKKAGQTTLQQEIDAQIKQVGEEDNALRKKLSLTQLLLEKNTAANRNANLGLYITLLNKGGALHDFTGADVVNAWYKRNLYMYSLVQKLTEAKDERVMIVVGAGHAAVFKHFIDMDQRSKVVELSEVLKN
ncbi:hypothetical protein SAMN04488128_1011132 [Chitinophaga eiseniae]|uniref:Haem-binding uptake, Tiki superfamily, ChaN n=1 Tax=Chitinophaga eiseniae TaxID=634771 RepID=A0A1T4MJI1_9BACT|nr:DUF5694 domain-containing protein [Chitinophaga eiseniae]SJZ67011.1 hypothetical protein SAMN04488128_1011132 [Chitinophaga eiseniae]